MARAGMSGSRSSRQWIAAVLLLLALALLPGELAGAAVGNGPDRPAAELAAQFRLAVDRRLDLPESEQALYAELLGGALGSAGIAELGPQFLLLVDRDPLVQAIMLLWKPRGGRIQLVGAAPASTGRPGRYEYFETPLGVFRHSLNNPDFRAEGTRNENGILGYGPKGMRVYDFGWQPARRGWGDGGASLMRLQMHSTDPDMLEPLIGTPQSKGCIRIPISLNRFLDRHSVLDADYQGAAELGMKIWVWNGEREMPAGSGRYLVVVDSQRSVRPDWSAPPSP